MIRTFTTTARAGAALVVAAAGIAVGHGTAVADPHDREAHKVTYTVTVTSDLTANIQYIDTEPTSQSAYDADPSKYIKTLHTPISGGQPLVYSTSLSDPKQWALITASGGLRVNPEFHCEIAIDGEVVVSQQGGSGVTCSTRAW